MTLFWGTLFGFGPGLLGFNADSEVYDSILPVSHGDLITFFLSFLFPLLHPCGSGRPMVLCSSHLSGLVPLRSQSPVA